MRCPKCSYLSYEDVPRCRNCGYDFSLAVPPEVADAPTLDEPAAARAWQEAGARTPQDPADQMTPLDESTAVDLPLFEPPDAPGTPEAPGRPRADVPDPAPPRPRPSDPPMQLDPPPVPIPPAPPPLVVRRTVDVPRPRPATPTEPGGLRPSAAGRARPAPPAPAPALDFDEPPRRVDRPLAADEPATSDNGDNDSWHLPAAAREADDDATEVLPQAGAAADSGLGPRLLAGAIDAGLLIGINLLVVWLTLRLLALTWGDAGRLPVAPLVGFLALLDVSYLVTFTAASGQSIGKMLTGLRVTSDDGGRVPFGHAVLRSVIVLLCAVPAGLGLLPVLFDPHGRGLHDRMAGTRVGPAE